MSRKLFGNKKIRIPKILFLVQRRFVGNFIVNQKSSCRANSLKKMLRQYKQNLIHWRRRLKVLIRQFLIKNIIFDFWLNQFIFNREITAMISAEPEQQPEKVFIRCYDIFYFLIKGSIQPFCHDFAWRQSRKLVRLW